MVGLALLSEARTKAHPYIRLDAGTRGIGRREPGVQGVFALGLFPSIVSSKLVSALNNNPSTSYVPLNFFPLYVLSILSVVTNNKILNLAIYIRHFPLIMNTYLHLRFKLPTLNKYFGL